MHLPVALKAIDLIDEAAAKLKMEISTKPEALDEVDRKVSPIFRVILLFSGTGMSFLARINAADDMKGACLDGISRPTGPLDSCDDICFLLRRSSTCAPVSCCRLRVEP